MTADPRAVLDTAAARVVHTSGPDDGSTYAERDPAPYAALRVVLDELDFLDNVDLFAGPIFRLRTVIETALEAS